MSALPDDATILILGTDPDHFWRWLSARSVDQPQCLDPFCFVPRRLYGEYVVSLIEPMRAGHYAGGSLTVMANVSTSARTRQVLRPGWPTEGIWQAISPFFPPGMADSNRLRLTLLSDRHRGRIVAMSRRGLLAKVHRRVDAVRIEEADVPFGASAIRLLHWLRQRIDEHVAQGGDWRGVIDGIRPYTQRLWRELPFASRRSFLEHARAWWDVHCHRMAESRDADHASAG